MWRIFFHAKPGIQEWIELIIKIPQCWIWIRVFLFCLFRIGFFLSVAYLTVANSALLGFSVLCWVTVTVQYLVRFLSLCWITGGHNPPIYWRTVTPTGIEPIPLWNLASKVAGWMLRAFTPCLAELASYWNSPRK